MDKLNIYALIRLGSFALNFVLIMMLYKGCNCKQCPELVKQTVVVEKVYGDTGTAKQVVDVIAPKPKNVALNAKKLAESTIDSLPCDTAIQLVKELVHMLPDTCDYSDTFRVADDYRISYYAKVEGQLIDFRIWHTNLKPDTRTTITNTVAIKPKPQIYLGAVVGINNTATNFVAGPSAAIAYRSFMGNYTYDFRSGSHQIGGYWRVWGK